MLLQLCWDGVSPHIHRLPALVRVISGYMGPTLDTPTCPLPIHGRQRR